VVAPHRAESRLVLEALVLEPGLDEVGVGVEIAAVDLDAGRVEAVQQRLVQGGATPAARPPARRASPP
jgi:hypothetical protein